MTDEETEVQNLEGMAFLEIEEITVHEWHALPDGGGPPLQVHMVIKVAGLAGPLIMRFKGPHSIGRLIGALRKHRDNVWPQE